MIIVNQGNCPKLGVYIYLPTNEFGEDILEGIKKLMQGIKIRCWKYDSTSKRNIRRSNHKPALILYLGP